MEYMVDLATLAILILGWLILTFGGVYIFELRDILRHLLTGGK